MKLLYMVLKAMPWDAITVHGVPIVPPEDGPAYFMPVFKTHEAAVAWLDGDDVPIQALGAPDDIDTSDRKL